MVYYCCVPGCNNTSRQERMHRFPYTDKLVYDEWITRVKNPKLKAMPPSNVYKSYRVCNVHFNDVCIIDPKMYHHKSGLKERSLPSINIPEDGGTSGPCITPHTDAVPKFQRRWTIILADGNLTSNNSSEMDEIPNCIDDKVWIDETVISGGFIDKKPCYAEYKQENIYNYVSIKDENIDNLTVLLPGSEHVTDYIEDKVCLNKTIIRRGDIKQEPCDIKDKQGSIHNYLTIKDESIDDLTVAVQETEVITDYIDNKACVCETEISGGYIKDEPCNMGDEWGSIHNNDNMKGCEECGEEYDLYCLKCPMLIRIFDSNNPDGRDDTVGWTLPKNFVDICDTPSGMGIVALRTIPEGVVFGPFKGLVSSQDDTTVSKWKLKNKKLVYTKDPRWLNWMQYVRRADQDSHRNLIPFQYEDGLYYRSEHHINVGDELLVCWDSDSKKSEIQEMEDSYWEPRVCESLDDSYACTFCCVGYKSINHLKAHNSTCIEKRNKKDFCGDIIQCDVCNIYLDKKEYSDYHMDRCYKSNEKCRKKNREGPLRPFVCTFCTYKAMTKWQLKEHAAIHNSDRPFVCTLCTYKGTSRKLLKRHVDVHNDDKPFACTLCTYKATTNWKVKRHVASHHGDKPYACSLCPYKTATKGSLKRHILIHSDDKPYACTLCPYKTATIGSLKAHIAIHNDDKPFACTLCPYKTATRGSLKQHIVSHNADKPFACTFCPFKTRRKTNLQKHIVIHNADKPFACTFCPYKTRRKTSLKKHIAAHNDDKPFACTLCPFRTTRSSNLKQHIAIHNKHKPFVCTLCPYETTRKSILKRHVTSHNDNDTT